MTMIPRKTSAQAHAIVRPPRQNNGCEVNEGIRRAEDASDLAALELPGLRHKHPQGAQ